MQALRIIAQHTDIKTSTAGGTQKKEINVAYDQIQHQQICIDSLADLCNIHHFYTIKTCASSNNMAISETPHSKNIGKSGSAGKY